MSHSRKKLKAKALDDEVIPTEKESIVRVIELRGANICEIVYADGTKVLCQIPQRFTKTIWIKRGNYLIVREPHEVFKNSERKIRALVEHVLFPEQIKNLKKQNLWPKEFEDTSSEQKEEEVREKEEENEEDLFVNPNRRQILESDEEEESEEEEEEESDEEEEKEES